MASSKIFTYMNKIFFSIIMLVAILVAGTQTVSASAMRRVRFSRPYQVSRAISSNVSLSVMPTTTAIVTAEATPTDAVLPIKNITTVSASDANIDTVTTRDTTPRIMYWWGKVNQHINTATGKWETDPDGISGANLDALVYCKKFYPRTKKIEEYKMEKIQTWREAGNVNAWTNTKMSLHCVQR
jgi:hypothetical protein